DSLRDATIELRRAASIREMESRTAHGQVVDAVEELHIPDRSLYLFDAHGQPIKLERADEWIRALAQRAARDGSADEEHDAPRNQTLRLHAERFTLASGVPMVAVAIANQIELEDRYAALIVIFSGAAAVALLLVAAGGWLLVRKSTTPIERSVDQMRRFMADAARVVAQAKGVTLEVADFDEALVEGDPTLLRQLVMILLDNAVKFTPAQGHVRVHIGAPAGRPTLVVEDSGVGISREQLPHVF